VCLCVSVCVCVCVCASTIWHAAAFMLYVLLCLWGGGNERKRARERRMGARERRMGARERTRDSARTEKGEHERELAGGVGWRVKYD